MTSGICFGLETVKAGEQNRHPFVFVSLTATEILPEWLGPESVGGKTTNGSEISGLESEALEKWATDIDKLRMPSRMPKEWRHWAVLFWRYLIVAVATRQWSWAGGYMHFELVFRMAEEEAFK